MAFFSENKLTLISFVLVGGLVVATSALQSRSVSSQTDLAEPSKHEELGPETSPNPQPNFLTTPSLATSTPPAPDHRTTIRPARVYHHDDEPAEDDE